MSSASLEGLPTEVLCQVVENLDLESLLHLIRASPRFYRIFALYRTSIVLPILKREFSPLDGLFRLLAMSPDDLKSVRGTWSKRRIHFNSRVVCEEQSIGTEVEDNEGGMEEVCLHKDDWRRLVQVCTVVKRWEAIFPRLRFSQRPQLARSLFAHEAERLRGALYTWWRYAFYFHGDLPRPSQWIPDSLSTDARLNVLRVLSTAEMYELRDFWETITFAIETEICPSIDRVRTNAGTALSEAEAARLAWGNMLENKIIVETVLKLTPPEILHYLCNQHAYSRARLVHDIRLRHPTIERDRETLSGSLFTVIFERRWFLAAEKGKRAVKRRKYFPLFSFPKHHGGILDYKRPWEKLRTMYGDDGGKGILEASEVEDHPRIFSRRPVPRGQLEP